MHQALIMPLSERKDRMARLRGRVFTVTAEAYCRDFLKALAG
jgi:trehalose 6-phosphate synthase